MQNGLIRVTAWLITLLLVVVLAGVIGWTLRSQPTMLALPTPHAAVAAAAPSGAAAATELPDYDAGHDACADGCRHASRLGYCLR